MFGAFEKLHIGTVRSANSPRCRTSRSPQFDRVPAVRVLVRGARVRKISSAAPFVQQSSGERRDFRRPTMARTHCYRAAAKRVRTCQPRRRSYDGWLDARDGWRALFSPFQSPALKVPCHPRAGASVSVVHVVHWHLCDSVARGTRDSYEPNSRGLDRLRDKPVVGQEPFKAPTGEALGRKSLGRHDSAVFLLDA